MAEKKLPRHKRLYKDSPTLERSEDGSMKSSKSNDKRGEKASESEKEADKVQAGTDDMAVKEPHEEARIQEIKDMHKRHESEMKAVHSRHEKEDAKKYDNPNGDSNEKPDAGKKEISEIEKNEKISE